MKAARYLLGQLSDEEQDRFEQESLMDDQRFEELVSAEDDLIDAYVAGELPPEDARRFEARFLSVPARRERVEFARSLHRLAAAEAGPLPAPEGARPGAPRGSRLALAASLAAAAVGGWSLLQVRELSRALHEARGEQQALDRRLAAEQARAGALAADLAAAREAPGAVVGWTLQAGGERSHGSPAARSLAPEVEWVRLRLRAPGIPPTARVRLTLETAEGAALAVQEGLRARGGAVEVILPAALLAPGSYVITLGGAPPPDGVFGAYTLTVVPPAR
jgi:hypothetical protein